MSDTDREYQKPDTWDWEQAEMRPPVKRARVIVSVAFPRPDFERVAAYAERVGKRTSEFIREATLQSVPSAAREPVVVSDADLRPVTEARGSIPVAAEPGTFTSLALAPP